MINYSKKGDKVCKKGPKILSFAKLVENVKTIEGSKRDSFVYNLLGMTNQQFDTIKSREKDAETLESKKAYELFFKYCNFRDIDSNDFFTRELTTAEEEVSE
jgi:hypothetical protein